MKTYTDLGAVPTAYRDLLKSAGTRQFLNGDAWYATFAAEALEPGAQPRIYGVEETPGLPALVLLTRTPALQNGSMLSGSVAGLRTLASMTNYQSNIFAPVIGATTSDLRRVCGALASHLASERPRWDLIDLNYLDPSAPFYSPLVDALREAGLVVKPYFHCHTWYENTEGLNYQAYLKQRSPSVHKALQNYARKARKLERESTVRYEIFASGDIDVAMRHYTEVYDASWKEPEPFPRFVPAYLRAAAEAGALRMGILFINEEPVATETAVVSDGRATMVKTAYKETFKNASVGSLIIMHVMQHLLDVERVREIDFGPFDAPYKALWVSQRRELRGVVCYNRTAGGYYAQAQHLAIARARAARARLKPIVEQVRKRLSRQTDERAATT